MKKLLAELTKQKLRQGPFPSLSFLLYIFIFITIRLPSTSTSFFLSPRLGGRSLGRKFRLHCTLQRMSTSSGSSPPRAGDASPGTSSNPLEALGLPVPILLGSASFTRKLILKEMNIPFHKVVRPIDEKALGDRSQDPPNELVLTLANAKMDHLVKELQQGKIGNHDLPVRNDGSSDEWILLTGDQVVTCEGIILEKPESIEEAKQFVQKYGNNPPSTVGSCVLHHFPSNVRVAGVDTATIYFDPTTLSTEAADSLVDTLVEQGEPVMSCAGGLMIEHPLVQEHVQRIDGTQDSVMGLSKPLVESLLQEMATKLKGRNA